MTNKYCQFLRSALTPESALFPKHSVQKWLFERNEQVEITVRKIRFADLNHWFFDGLDGALRHDSGRFFSIEGIEVETNWGSIHTWQQPIINQPEIGILGIIAKEFNGVLYLLMQAKTEPGNMNKVQLSPTLQATKSNYTQVHKGRKPLYLEYFLERKRYRVLLDQLQSEQGARFLRKRNRNIIIEVNEEIPLYDDFVWLTLGQVKALMGENNLVNMDTRTVISGIPYGYFSSDTAELFASLSLTQGDQFAAGMLKSALDDKDSLYTLDDIISWITNLKTMYDLKIRTVRLQDIKDWVWDDFSIHHRDNKFFSVIAAEVEISSREVQKWSQPLIEPAQEGLIAFIVRQINGVFHFLVQAKLECGNFDILEMAPTVQCLTGNYRETQEGTLPFLEYVLAAPPGQVRYDALQSEEGGRFFCEQNRNVIIEADEHFPINVPDNFMWMTLCQLSFFLKFNNYLNIQARSLISAIRFM